MAEAYNELRSLARAMIRKESPGHTLQATALVHEIYVRLAARRELGVRSREDFLGVARWLMRRVLVDHARRRAALKRSCETVAAPVERQDERLLSCEPKLREALERLRAIDARQAAIVEHRFLRGLNVSETASLLQVSEKTVKRDWSTARVWLFRELTRTNHAGK